MDWVHTFRATRERLAKDEGNFFWKTMLRVLDPVKAVLWNRGAGLKVVRHFRCLFCCSLHRGLPRRYRIHLDGNQSRLGSRSVALPLLSVVYDRPNRVKPAVFIRGHLAAKGFTKLLLKLLPGNVVVRVYRRVRCKIQQLWLSPLVTPAVEII
jgi:hypothetical protein